MNLPILLTAVVMTFAVIGHVLIGTRETAQLEPKSAPGAPVPPKTLAHWVQAMCAFQMLTPDLIVVTGLLYVLALSNVIAQEQLFALCLAGYFALQGLLWMGHLLWLRRPGVGLLRLPHWAVWFLCAGLMWLGA